MNDEINKPKNYTIAKGSIACFYFSLKELKQIFTSRESRTAEEPLCTLSLKEDDVRNSFKYPM